MSYEALEQSEPRSPDAAGRTRLSSVATAIRLLKAFGVDDRELGISELAQRLGVSKSTVHRLASTLLAERLLEQNPETNRYRLGAALFTLGTLARRSMDVSAEAKPHLLALRAELEENVRLALLDRTHVLYVYDFESPQPVRLRSQTGLAKPVWCTAEGWVLLSDQDPPGVAAALDSPRRPVTQNTNVERDAILARIEEAGRKGWAFEDEESEAGMRALAAPIRAADGRVLAAIALAGPRMRIRKRLLPQLTQRLLETAGTISARFGWSG